MISVIIPARNEPYLQKTIDDLFAKAAGDIEVIAVLDGYWPRPPLTKRKDLVIIHRGEVRGMRSGINAGAGIAKGKYLMKCDAHCCFDRGFDEKLKADCESNWTVVPRRYGLDVEKWDRIDKMYEFEYIEKGTLKGRKWPEYAERVKGKKIVDLMTSQGSCWFMHRDRFFELGGLDEINYGGMGREAQETCLKAWLSGGRYVLNRNTWYAHWNKPKEHVVTNRKEKRKSVEYATSYWAEDKIKPVIEKFAPVPTWDTRKEISMLDLLKRYGVDLKESSPIIVPKFKRKHLSKLFRDMGFKKGAEIGVAVGKYSEYLCKFNPGVELISVDPWSSYSEDPRRIRKHEENYQESQKRLAPYGATLMRMMSMDAVRDIPPESLDFVYIDGNHMFDFVMQDIIEWSKRVRPGGIVSGHDYYRFRNAGVVEAVDVYTKMHKIRQWFLCDERPASFFWVKQ